MSAQPMLACGCRAYATLTLANGEQVPACVVHDCHEQVAEPDLTGRVARCSCGKERPSDGTGGMLAFFEYLGPGSQQALHICKHCRYYDEAHREQPCSLCTGAKVWGATPRPCPRCKGTGTRQVSDRVCANFEPIGDVGHDRFYCGCRGWD